MSQWLPIGRFSQTCGLTVRALRYYESQGLLLPARVDPESGYRFYQPEQLADALHVRLLRALEMPLADVVSVMRAPDSAEARALLVAHRARVGTRVADLERLLARFDEWLEGAPAELNVDPAELDEPPAATPSEPRESTLARAFLALFGPAMSD